MTLYFHTGKFDNGSKHTLMNNSEIISYIRKITLGITAVLLFLFPLFFLTNTTDPFILPKQVLLVVVVAVLAFLWSLVAVYQRKVSIRISPFNISIGVFTVAVLLSALLSRNIYDSLATAIPVASAAILCFIIINIVSNKREFTIVFSSIVLGAVVSTFISIAYYFKLYFLPIPNIQNQYFSTFGSPIQHVLYIAPLLIITVFALLGETRRKKIQASYSVLFYSISALVLLVGTGLILYQIMSVAQKPVLLPYTYGFQIATAAVTQDYGAQKIMGIDVPRLLISLPFGSGYGTFLSDFTRFKLVDINNNQALWGIPFTYSSSYVLEILATVGLVGLLSYFFIIFQVLRTKVRRMSPIFLGLLSIFLLSFFLPFSITEVALMLILLGVYSSYLFLIDDRRVYDMSLSLVAFQEGLISFAETPEGGVRKSKKDSMVLPILISIVVLLIGGYMSYLAIKLVMADTKIAESLSAANKNNGQKIYDLQRQALIDFPYRADYYRIFSQVNLALANSVASGIKPGATPNATTQQTISQLLQQATANARTSVALAPATAVNWEYLAQIYRNLIGVGQGADQFAIATQNQAILLDPQNPLLRIELGGIYYQLEQYDAAQNQFEAAVRLKPDLSTAYYNLGHALEAKGDLEGALQQYQNTMSLIKGNPSDSKKLQGEIDALTAKIGTTPKGTTPVQGSGQNQPPLELNAAPSPIPTQATGQIKVPPPPTGQIKASPTPTGAPTPTP